MFRKIIAVLSRFGIVAVHDSTGNGLTRKEIFHASENDTAFSLGISRGAMLKTGSKDFQHFTNIGLFIKDRDKRMMIHMDAESADLIARSLLEAIIKNPDVDKGNGKWRQSSQVMQLHEIYNVTYGVGNDNTAPDRKVTVQ